MKPFNSRFSDQVLLSTRPIACILLLGSSVMLFGCEAEDAVEAITEATVSTAPALFSESNADESASNVIVSVASISNVKEISSQANENISVSQRYTPMARQSATLNCTTSGTFTLAIDDADDSGFLPLTAGDSQSFTFDQCLGADVLTDGILFVEYDEISPAETLFPTNLTITYMIDMLVSGDEGTIAMDGDLTASLVNESPVASVSYSGSELALLIDGATAAELTDFAVSVQTDSSTSPATVTTDFNGVYAFSEIGVMTVTTLTSFVNLVGSNPIAGQAVFSSGSESTQGNDSAIRITAMSDGETVQVDVDVNGDGIYEISNTKAWSEL